MLSLLHSYYLLFTVVEYYSLLYGLPTRFHKSNYSATGGADHSSNGGRRVADMFMLVPRARVRAFALFLSVPPVQTWHQPHTCPYLPLT